MKQATFRRTLLAASVSALFAISTPIFAASNSTGGVKGHVTAADNTSLAGATIVIVNKENGATKTVTANENGNFRVPSLAIGEYKITISKPGYETQVVEAATVTIGNEVTIDTTMTSGDIERISVTGSRVAMVDTASPEIALSISASEIARLPISQDMTSVALLAPGTTKGDGAFGNRASFGGSSVAENSYIVNGVNITGFRNGLAIADIPFSAYEEFQVKTGGYSAQFGRSTGGVINAVTKSGGNEWKFEINGRWEPDALREDRPDVRYAIGNGTSIKPFDMYEDNSHDEVEKFEGELAISGPLIKDKLFIYGLIQPQSYKDRNASANGLTYTDRKIDDPLWLGRIDWQISEDHKLMVWGFSDAKDQENSTKAWVKGTASEKFSVLETGGTTWSVKYDGRFTDWLSMDALYAEVEFDSTQQSPEDASCPYIADYRSGAGVALGCWQTAQPTASSDKRKQYNMNFYVNYFDDHQIKLGVDYEDDSANEMKVYSGGVGYNYYFNDKDYKLDNDYVLDQAMEYVRVTNYTNGGTFSSASLAWFIEDTWSILPNLTARIGIRNESFENKNASDQTFIKIDNQWAPRLGLTWDVFDNGESKVFANFGRYHIPVATNTNIRLAGTELYTRDWYALDGVNADDTPILGAALGPQKVYGNGVAASPDEIVNSDIKPMYQDEYILGYQQNLDEDWAAGIKFTHRDLKSVIDDISIKAGLEAMGYDGSSDPFILSNPGKDATVYFDTDGDGTLEQIHISAEDLGFPEAVRKYSSVELTLNRRWNDDWMLNASYTWAHSYGNAEGYVKSDNGQDDAGLTTDWDYPYLMDGAYGNLPNDRRHTIKVFGAYQLTDNVTVGTNITAQSGRPKNALSYSTLPDDYPEEYQYGDTFYPFGVKCSRGCMGTEAWTFTVDANVTYNIDYWDDVNANVKLDVFNLFNAQTVTKTNEYLDEGGLTSPTYGLAEEFVAPRYVRVSFNVAF
ncbi:TonB-dependent receptor [Shewanella sp. C32]|uniref:TonB-dependent receptor n=1 Tax=Shewanella electrica TaxID=515560 RepID=A0ABT2FP33_9GAMM|nr:TonB-dependent receptor [Shewanella electrica]MCH1925658.1 TonB-dependent receptor [Shewanella electrica]MCS4558093.1 TonB-dependent receptor [Shewanella electrica]